MSEAERNQELKAIQLELFQLRRKEKELKARRRFVLLNGGKEKRCKKCGDTMDLDQFYKDARYADGLYPRCIECKNGPYRKGNASFRGSKAA